MYLYLYFIVSVFATFAPQVRPALHHNTSLNVVFGLALTQIIDVVSV